MRYFSLFTGVGGFEIGIENAYEDNQRRRETSVFQGVSPSRIIPNSADSGGGKTHPICVGQSEIDKHASAVLKYRFPNVKNYGDISKIDWSDVPDFDLLVGGSPCQDFSIAGKRAGLAGARSGLFGEYVRSLEEKKPQHFIWENVKGVLSSNRGRDFAAILLAFSETGYSLSWQVLNAKDFGVPQNRERVFVVGTRGEGGREVFFEREDVGNGFARSGQEPWGTCLSSRSAGGENCRGNYEQIGSRIRRLTPIECERLMSWTDNWTKYGDYGNGPKEISDTQRYKMCGNGVVSKVVEEIVYHLL